MLANLLVVLAFAIVSIVNLVSDKTDNLEGIYVTKPLLMPLLALYYVMSATDHNWLIVFALICGFFGDIFLLWPENKLFFSAGLVSFLSGHILYTVVFLETTSFLADVPDWFYVLTIPFLIYAVVFLKVLYPFIKSYLIPVFVYILGMITMSFTSLTRLWNVHNIEFWLPFIGSLLFIISDSILSFQSFKLKKRTPDGEVWIMSTYILAELCIVLGFLR